MIDEEKKELKEEKDSKEKDLEKSIKEQKEVLQDLQNDIRVIKESLQELRGIVEGTSKFSLLYVLGGVYIAIGLAMMGFSVSYSSPSLRILGVPVGFFIFLAGMFMIKGTYYAGTNVNKYPNKCTLKELWHTNKWLFCSFLCIACAFLTFIVLFFLSFSLFYLDN